ncbi:MAG: motility protein A [Planctomycetota bacterium]|jgi:chemotaxis protein MotA
MDLATIVGYILGITFMLLGIGFDDVILFVDIPSAIIVFGGCIAAVMIATPVEGLKNGVSVMKKVFGHTAQSPEEMIKRMVEFAEIARRDGILALENVTENIQDEYLVTGIQLAVDGTDPELIENIMLTDLERMEDRHATGKTLFVLAEKYAPAWGMIGTLIGLVKMLAKGVDDPSALTAAMAVALITTMYGSVCANYLFGPVADKLSARSDEELLMKQVILKGVMSIQQGDNPRIVDQKLRIFLPPAQRSTEE